MTLRVSLFVVAALLMAAHFLREGNYLLVVLWLLTPLLFLTRNRLSLIVLQLVAYFAALTWIDTAIRLVEDRILLGQEWIGVVVILGAVTLFTVLAGALLNSPVMKEKYPGK